MLQNAYLLAKIGADTAENERHFAKNWQLPYGSTGPRRVELRGLHAVLLRGLGLHAVRHVDALELQLRVLLAELHHLSRAGKKGS